jgi:hypothetical protein
MSDPRSTFSIGLQIAKEDTYSVAPDNGTNPNYWQGGRWIPITTQGIPDMWDRQETIFPEGRAGSRAMMNRRPVVGRRWSDGSFGFEMTSDFMPLLMYGALGSMSSNSVPSTDPLLKAEEPIPAETSELQVLDTQPSDGGAILRFSVNETSVGGWISVSGIDADGNGASEVISFSSAGSLYTRTSFSAIGASSIMVWSDNPATIDIHGFKYFEHTVSINETSNPSFSIMQFGDPTAGATSKLRMFTGMVVQEVELNTPADQRDGLVTGSVQFEGNPTATCDATSLTSVSAVQVWPAWVMSITREGVSYDKALDFSFTFNAGNRNYRTAAGVQNPQGAVYLSQSLEGSMRLFLEDEVEYNKWKGASSNNFVATWNSPYKLTTTDFQEITASMNSLYYDEVDRADDADLQVLEVDFMTINNADTGLLKMQFKNNIPGSAYSSYVVP